MLTIVRRKAQSLRATFEAEVMDPFGFATVLDDLTLEPQDLPGLRRERRLDGSGL